MCLWYTIPKVSGWEITILDITFYCHHHRPRVCGKSCTCICQYRHRSTQPGHSQNDKRHINNQMERTCDFVSCEWNQSHLTTNCKDTQVKTNRSEETYATMMKDIVLNGWKWVICYDPSQNPRSHRIQKKSIGHWAKKKKKTRTQYTIVNISSSASCEYRHLNTSIRLNRWQYPIPHKQPCVFVLAVCTLFSVIFIYPGIR